MGASRGAGTLARFCPFPGALEWGSRRSSPPGSSGNGQRLRLGSGRAGAGPRRAVCAFACADSSNWQRRGPGWACWLGGAVRTWGGVRVHIGGWPCSLYTHRHTVLGPAGFPWHVWRRESWRVRAQGPGGHSGRLFPGWRLPGQHVSGMPGRGPDEASGTDPSRPGRARYLRPLSAALVPCCSPSPASFHRRGCLWRALPGSPPQGTQVGGWRVCERACPAAAASG